MIYLRIAAFGAADVVASNTIEAYSRAANDMLKPHGMAIRHRYGTGPVVHDWIVWTGYVSGADATVEQIRHVCHQTWSNGKGLPVILANAGNEPNHAYGFTHAISGLAGKGGWLPYCIINAQKLNPAGTTLLHEMIHATGLGNEAHDDDPRSVFFGNRLLRPDEDPQRARELFANHAERLRQSYFAENG